MTSTLKTRLSTPALGLLLAACGGGGGSGGEQAVTPPTGPRLGSVTVMSATTCARGPGALPNTSCMQLMIDDMSVPAIEVELRVTEPDPGTTLRGTVLMGTGLFGTSFYEDEGGGDLLIPLLTADGFRVVQRAWVSGWFASGGGVLPQSIRFATLVTWVEENLHTGGKFCVTGNSGGAAEIAYALSTWDRADIIDAAVLSSGPPLSRLDYLCTSPPSTEWIDLCRTLVPAGGMECAVRECTVAAGSQLCAGLPQSSQMDELEADSIMHPGAEMDYPNTEVYGLLGAQDCTIAVPLALLYLNAVNATKQINYISGAPHLLPSTAGGRAAIHQALLSAAPISVPVTTTQTRTTKWGREQHVEFQQAERR